MQYVPRWVQFSPLYLFSAETGVAVCEGSKDVEGDDETEKEKRDKDIVEQGNGTGGCVCVRVCVCESMSVCE